MWKQRKDEAKDAENNSNVKEEQKESKDPVNDNDSYYFIYDGKKFNAGDKISSIEEKTDLVVREREKQKMFQQINI